MTNDPFGASRPRLLGLAYRMLGSRSEAEDVLQDAWLRFNSASAVENRDALLTTIVTRLCLDRLKRARVRREVYVGPWLPEPIVDTGAMAPDVATELANDLSFALLLALDRLKPAERAAFLLHDVFDIPFAEIAAILGRGEAACRQLAKRAREAVRHQRPATKVSRDAHQRLLLAFGMAVTTGDISGLTSLLSEDAMLLSDGGGKVQTALNPIRGADRIARFFIGIVRKFGQQNGDMVPLLQDINGLPAIVVCGGSGIDQILSIQTDGERIDAVYLVRNPEKLDGVAQVLPTMQSAPRWL